MCYFIVEFFANETYPQNVNNVNAIPLTHANSHELLKNHAIKIPTNVPNKIRLINNATTNRAKDSIITYLSRAGHVSQKVYHHTDFLYPVNQHVQYTDVNARGLPWLGHQDTLV